MAAFGFGTRRALLQLNSKHSRLDPRSLISGLVPARGDLLMATSRRTYGAIIGVSLFVAGLVGPFTLFELTQPGHSVNQYYRELHPTTSELIQQDMTPVSVARVSHKRRVSAARAIVMPTGLIVAMPPR
jgi:hypothetical protein